MVMLKTLPRWAAIGLLMGLLGIGAGAAARAMTQSAALGLRLVCARLRNRSSITIQKPTISLGRKSRTPICRCRVI